MEVLNVDTFKEKIFDFEEGSEWKFKGSRPAIVDFYADWCGPCQALNPILEEVEQQYEGKVDIYKVDTEATPELTSLFGIKGIPAILFIPKDGDPAMNAGLIPKEGFDKAISELFGIQ